MFSQKKSETKIFIEKLIILANIDLRNIPYKPYTVCVVPATREAEVGGLLKTGLWG